MTIYAYTKPEQYLPDYINIKDDAAGIMVTVRQMQGRGHEDGEVIYAHITLSEAEGRKLYEALKKRYEQGDY